MDTSPRRFVILALGLAGGLVATIGLFNYFVDPYGLFGQNRLGIHISAEREFKPSQVQRYPHDALVLGTSRMAMIPVDDLKGFRFFNAGFGGGTAEVAVISLGGIVNFQSLRVAGDKMDSAIADYVKRKHNLAIGDQTTEEIKINIGTAMPDKEPKVLEIRGRDLISGLPRNIKITSNEVSESISDVLVEIVQTIKNVLRDTPPELSADIMDKGMVLSGGSSLLRNLSELVTQSIGVPCTVADNSLLCVAKGTGAVLENLEFYKKSIMNKK